MAKEKNKKKGCLIAVIAVVVIGVIAAAAGGGKKKDDSSSQSNGKVSVSSSTSSENQGKVNTDKESKSAENGDVSEEANDVIYDDGGIKITYTGYTASKMFTSASLNFLIENNSDKNITVENFNLNINGYTLDTWFYEQVPASKKSNVKMDIYDTQLKENGIDTLGTVDMNFRCIDSDTYDELFITNDIEIVFDETVSSEENLDDYQLVVDQDDVQVYYKGLDHDGWISDTSFKFLIVNNSNRNVTLSADNISVNDFAMSTLFHGDCAAGKKTNETIDVYKSTIEDNNIEKITKLEFSLRCYDSDTYDDIWETNAITIEITE
ncbi:MAG: hypothetical protein IJ571_07135 [Ruminococcus sp.]|nr:hypothetical protein [Ruminococcus sp.]